MNLIVGTAGHIDHGKTALVLALTGENADRLPEEKSRGITIDLGFAELRRDETRIGFVDVPGHERFVKNMLAGASGIDVVILVVAADEGVMPQTREHFEICRLLGTKRGLIVLTKKDLVEAEFIELVELDVAELVEGSFLENAPVLSVSSKTGEGIDEVRNELFRLASETEARAGDISTQLPIDRSFSVKGFGAVVTGTLTSGEISVGDELKILPLSKSVRVRGVQTHGDDVDRAAAGQRTAVNLGGIDHDEIERGMVLAETGALRPSQILDCRIEVLASSPRPIKSRQRVRVHLGTVEALARVEVLNEAREIQPGESDFVQLRLEIPVATAPDERFILRQYSPQITIAGGSVLDAHAVKRRRSELTSTRERLEKLSNEAIEWAEKIPHLLARFGNVGCGLEMVRAMTGLKKEPLKKILDEAIRAELVVEAEGVYVGRSFVDALIEKIHREVVDHHEKEPLSRGIDRETLRERTAGSAPSEVFRHCISTLVQDGKINAKDDIISSTEHVTDLSPEEEKLKEKMIATVKGAGLKVPAIKEILAESVTGTGFSAEHARKIFEFLINAGDVVKVSDEFYFSSEAIAELIKSVRHFAETEAENRLLGVPEFKDVAGVSRKHAIPLLEYLDGEGVTRRAGNTRIVL